ncbi:hypothetical protein SAMN05192540_2375 [Maribacter dokdonensis]|uniref:Uncharacterized protein n=1 Tax=Maribacter dokdonensis TaxID=320912 RepID=A0A1H4PU48_9FLAO|nr:hypothetical protein MAR621_02713 [Maribacter dokdonensis]SEC10840.1 hypothetical protein SAMN05192540_2375 [Maribacter dokdonensis]
MGSMKNYMRSICSTCTHHSYCSITKDKYNIHSCSEYVHFMDFTNKPITVISNEMSSSELNNELVLNYI